MHKKLFSLATRLPRWAWIVIVAAIVGGGFLLFHYTRPPRLDLVAVRRGTLIQEVSVTGKTQAVHSLELGFERSGIISRVSADVGSQVEPRQVLAQLDDSELTAQLREARATLEVQKANLAELERGARLEDIRISETELKKAQQDLVNDYNSVPDIITDAYNKADDAVRTQTGDIFFNYGGTISVAYKLTFTTGCSQPELDSTALRVTSSHELKQWTGELPDIASADPATLDTTIRQTENHLQTIQRFLMKTSELLDCGSVSLPQATIQTYKANVNTARNNVNGALTAVSNQKQTISAQKLTVERAQNELALKQAGATIEQLHAQVAQVAQAEAKVENIQAQIEKTILRSPLVGIVTRQDAKAGQVAAANAPLTAIISRDKLEIEANVPEVDIGKIKVGNPVRVTLDAFSGETFAGKVTYIDPAETIIDGVVNFKIKVSFEAVDFRFKSGLTANLNIETARRPDVLILPQFAIVENEAGVFVRVPRGANIVDVPITPGVRAQNGDTEIRSGVMEGQPVLNIGAKRSGT